MPRSAKSNFSSFTHLLIALRTHRPNSVDFSLSGTLAEMKETDERCSTDYIAFGPARITKVPSVMWIII
jgi:hypothetical protein